MSMPSVDENTVGTDPIRVMQRRKSEAPSIGSLSSSYNKQDSVARDAAVTAADTIGE